MGLLKRRARVVCVWIFEVEKAILHRIVDVLFAGFCYGDHWVPHLQSESVHHLTDILGFSCRFAGL